MSDISNIYKRKNTIFKQRNALQPKVYIGLTTDSKNIKNVYIIDGKLENPRKLTP
jgi:hypothetical protein